MQVWLVDAKGDYIRTLDAELQTSAEPYNGNIWNCATCGAEATMTPPLIAVSQPPRRAR